MCLTTLVDLILVNISIKSSIYKCSLIKNMCYILFFFSNIKVQQFIFFFFFFNDPPTTEIYPLPLHDALPISVPAAPAPRVPPQGDAPGRPARPRPRRGSGGRLAEQGFIPRAFRRVSLRLGGIRVPGGVGEPVVPPRTPSSRRAVKDGVRDERRVRLSVATAASRRDSPGSDPGT